jgi:hypothetical protein
VCRGVCKIDTRKIKVGCTHQSDTAVPRQDSAGCAAKSTAETNHHTHTRNTFSIRAFYPLTSTARRAQYRRVLNLERKKCVTPSGLSLLTSQSLLRAGKTPIASQRLTRTERRHGKPQLPLTERRHGKPQLHRALCRLQRRHEGCHGSACSP